MDSGQHSAETTASSASAIAWSWMLCVFVSGVVFGTIFIPRALLFCKSLRRRRTLRSSQSQTPDPPVYRYDVFLSFRGPDVRNNLIDHLSNHLTEKGIFTFKDDERLETGESVPEELLRAIQDSRASIVVFSSHYADSTWCLSEMAAIADRHRDSKQFVIPVFYDVETSHVRGQRGPYRDAFASLAKRYGRFWPWRGKVHRWKKAMTYLANVKGHDIRNKRQTIEIEKIVQDVIDKLDHQFSAEFSDLVGMQPRIENLERLLKLDSEDDDFRILGIRGMGGIGKTTHAMALYDRISYRFKARCFIEDVSETYRKPGGGATEVQKKILQRALKEKNLEIMHSPTHISAIVQNRLCNKNLPTKVLIVLDNVDELRQWNTLAINPKLLGRGSRVIITSRNEHILKASGAEEIYEVPLLNDDEAHKLFLRKTFTKYVSTTGEDVLEYANSLPSETKEMGKLILEYAQSLPLAITELGYTFNSLEQIVWGEAFMSMRKYPVKAIMKVLRTSIDELNLNERETFLHIACFFRGKEKKYVEHILDTCGISGPRYTIQQIMEKSLISIRNQEIHMHKMLQELGRDFVRGEYPEDPEKWNRLWHHDDFQKVLKETNNVKAIVLDQEESVLRHSHLKIEGLSKMMELQMLILHHNNCSENPNTLSNKLLYLFWKGYPFPSIPLPEKDSNLVELDLPDSNIQLLWEGKKEIPNLKRVDLSNSKELTKTPNFECCQDLVRLDLTGCTKLTEVHSSIALLKKLDYLSLRDCSSLAILDLGTNCDLSSLTVLHLSGCTKLKFVSLRGCTQLENTPDFTGLSNLKYLDLERCTSLSTVHESIEALATLKFLGLRGCTNLVQIPKNVSNMTSPLTLDLRGCIKLENLPLGHKVIMSSTCQESLILLDLGFSELRRIPNAIGELRCLNRLNLERSYSSYVSDTIKGFSRLSYLNLAHCRKRKRFLELPFDNLHQGKGMHTLIIGQDYVCSEDTKNALDASLTFMISSTSSGSSNVSSSIEYLSP